MTHFDKTKVHELLREPSEISISYRDALIRAYHGKISDLTDHFTVATELLRPRFPITLYYYSDNGGDLDDTAPKEIQRFLNDSLNAVSVLSGIEKPTIQYANTPAQAWVQGGFDLAQTTRSGLSGVGNITFLNCAPRIDERGVDGNDTNRGEPIYVGILPNGHVISANSRYNFVFFKDAIELGEIEVFEANVQPDGTQFRSRDIFPTHLAVLANRLTQNISLWKPEMTLEERRGLLKTVGYVDLEKRLTTDLLPTLQQFTVADIDVHGNVKLNVRKSELSEELLSQLGRGEFSVKFGNNFLTDARFTARMFDRPENGAGISTGSSGHDWQCADNHDGFLEVSIIGGRAADVLGVDQKQFGKPIVLELVFDRSFDLNLHNIPQNPRPSFGDFEAVLH